MLKKTKLCNAIAMATVLSGAVVGAGLGFYPSTASAVNLPANGLGQTLIFPYYITRSNWQTTVNLINTDEERLVVVKLRFMEGYNSRDVLDFNIIMSPGDVFSGVIEQTASGGVQFRRAPLDTTCTAPVIAPGAALPLSPVAFMGSTNWDTGPGSASDSPSAADVAAANDRLQEGHMIAIMMGAVKVGSAFDDLVTNPTLRGWANLSTPATAAQAALKTAAGYFLGAVHGTGGTTTCGTNSTGLGAQFKRVNILTTARLFGAPVNSLKGNYSFLNVPQGTAAGGNATALANSVAITSGAPTGATVAPNPRPLCGYTGGTASFGATYIDQFGAAGGGLVGITTGPYSASTYTQSTPIWDPNNDSNDCPNLITAQESPEFLQPTLGSVYPATSVNLENIVGDPTVPTGVTLAEYDVTQRTTTTLTLPYNAQNYLGGFAAVGEVLRAEALVNEWSINPNLGVATDWVITHPGKAIAVDFNPFSTQAAANPAWLPFTTPYELNTYLIPAGPFASAFDKFTSNTTASTVTRPIIGNGTSCNSVGFRLWDVDEQISTQGITPSPQPPATNLALCYETNVLTFSGSGTTSAVFDSKLVPAQLTNVINAVDEIHTLGGKYAGWMLLNLWTTTELASSTPWNGSFPATGSWLNGKGLPAVGFMIRERVIPTGTVLDNYSDTANHSVKRGDTFPAPTGG